MFFIFGFAPFLIKNFAVSVWPLNIAQWRAVFPSLASWTLISAPWLIRFSIWSLRPCPANMWIAACWYFLLDLFMSYPCLMNLIIFSIDKLWWVFFDAIADNKLLSSGFEFTVCVFFWDCLAELSCFFWKSSIIFAKLCLPAALANWTVSKDLCVLSSWYNFLGSAPFLSMALSNSAFFPSLSWIINPCNAVNLWLSLLSMFKSGCKCSIKFFRSFDVKTLLFLTAK